MKSHDELVALGLSRHQQGDLDAARRLYSQALEQKTSFDAAQWLGVLELQCGQFQQAASWLRQAAEIDQANAQVLANLGYAYAATADVEAAHGAYAASLALQSDNAETLAGLGNLYLSQRDFENAASCYEKAVSVNENLIDVWRNWSTALSSLGQSDLALGKLDQAERRLLRHGQSAARQTLIPVLLARGNLLMSMGRVRDARANFERVTKEAPGFAGGYLSLGHAWRELGQSDQALASYERAFQLEPANIEALHSQGLVKQDQGDLAAAQALYQRVLEAAPDHGPANRLLAGLTRYAPDDPGIARLQAAVERPGVPDEHLKHLHFALGKALEDVGEYDASFTQYASGNELHRSSIRYSIEHDEAEMRQLRQCFDRRYAERYTHHALGSGSQIKIPIFIVGLPRSGTSLIEQILASHPEVFGAGELNEFDHCLERALAVDTGRLASAQSASNPRPQKHRVERLAALEPEQLAGVGTDYLERVQSLTERRYIVDKMPANFRYVALIRAALPQAVIVHAQRHPLGTAWSLFKHFLSARGHAYSFSQEEIARYCLACHELMTHWHSLDDALLSIRYEDMVTQAEATMRTLIDRCGLPWNEACLEFYNTRRPVRTLSATQVRRPIYADAVQRWKCYSRQLEPLQRSLATLVEDYPV